MKKIFTLLCSASILMTVKAQTQVIENENFGSNSLSQLQSQNNWFFEGDATSSIVIEPGPPFFSSINNGGEYLRLGKFGNGNPSTIYLPFLSLPSDSIIINLDLASLATIFGPGAEAFYQNDVVNFSKSSSPTMEKFYSPVYNDSLTLIGVTDTKVTGIESYNEVTFATQIAHRNVPNSVGIELLSYEDTRTIIGYNEDSSLVVFDKENVFASKVCGIIDFNSTPAEIQAFSECSSALQNITALFNIEITTEVGIDNVVITRYYHEGCTNPDALNYDEFAGEDDGSCVIPNDFIDTENAPIHLPAGLDTISQPIVGTIILDAIEFCDIDYNASFDSVYISQQTEINLDSVNVEWTFVQGSSTNTLSTDLATSEIGRIKVFVTTYCQAVPQQKPGNTRRLVGNYNTETFGTVFQRLSTVTGLKNENSSNLSIYPNPIQEGNIHLSISQNWKLYDSMGQLLSTGSGQEIDMNNYSIGTYILQTENGREIISKQ